MRRRRWWRGHGSRAGRSSAVAAAVGQRGLARERRGEVRGEHATGGAGARRPRAGMVVTGATQGERGRRGTAALTCEQGRGATGRVGVGEGEAMERRRRGGGAQQRRGGAGDGRRHRRLTAARDLDPPRSSQVGGRLGGGRGRWCGGPARWPRAVATGSAAGRTTAAGSGASTQMGSGEREGEWGTRRSGVLGVG